MKVTKIIMISLLLFLLLFSCNKRKYTEVVEVPLPMAEEKSIVGLPDDIKADEGAFDVEKLTYSYEDLSPAIDPETMELNYSKHYLSYTNALNKVIVGTEFEKLSIEEILNKVDDSNLPLKNSAGGYYNYSLFWKSIGKNTGTIPADTLSAKIDRDFGSMENFKKEFISKANAHIGSGWISVIIDTSKKLQIITLSNNENSLVQTTVVRGKPLLIINLWEHAYYLRYKQKRKNYIDAVFQKIDWKKVSARFKDNDI